MTKRVIQLLTQQRAKFYSPNIVGDMDVNPMLITLKGVGSPKGCHVCSSVVKCDIRVPDATSRCQEIPNMCI